LLLTASSPVSARSGINARVVTALWIIASGPLRVVDQLITPIVDRPTSLEGTET